MPVGQLAAAQQAWQGRQAGYLSPGSAQEPEEVQPAEPVPDPQLAAAGVSVVEAYRLRGGTCGALFESLKADDTIFEFVRARMKVVRRRHVRYYRPGTITLGRSREYALV